MTGRERLPLLVLGGVLVLTVGGCGTQGSNPPIQPEVHFLVKALPGQNAAFKVDEIVAGGRTHPSIEGQEFQNITLGVDFVVEGANPPYHGTFTQIGDSQIVVTLSLVQAAGIGGDFTNTAQTSGDMDSVTVQGPATPGMNATPSPTPAAPTLETRIDVCATGTGNPTCLTANPVSVPKPAIMDPGTAGQTFSSNVGDAFSTHLAAGPLTCTSATCTNSLPLTPTIYFLEDAQQTIIAVFQPVTFGQVLLARLYLNSALAQGSGGTGQVVIRKDL